METELEALRAKVREQDAQIDALEAALSTTMKMLQCFMDASKTVGEIAESARGGLDAALSKIGGVK